MYMYFINANLPLAPLRCAIHRGLQFGITQKLKSFAVVLDLGSLDTSRPCTMRCCVNWLRESKPPRIVDKERMYVRSFTSLISDL